VALVSVILPVYNQERYLWETLTSILSQSFIDFELLILDDGSTDKSAQIIREFADKEERIHAYFEPNAGKSAATNKLVSRAKGDWCIFLDADDVMLPNRIERQLAFHLLNPNIQATSAYCQYINEKGNTFGIQRYSSPSKVSEYKRANLNVEFVTCSYTSLMVAKKLFVEVGGLLQKYEPCEDFEFFNRLVDKGFILFIIPEVLMKYRIHPDAITVRKPVQVLNMINFVQYCLRQRRLGEDEISFETFLIIQEAKSWWAKINQRRFNYAMIYFRSAGLAMLSRNYGVFFLQIAASSVLSPFYVLKKILNHTKS
jgi:glycosyltransferase involved in cell wall biosynthesis